MKLSAKRILQFIYLFITLLILVLIGLLDPNITGFFKHPPAVSNTLLLWCLFSIIGYWLTDGIIIRYITSFIYGKITFKKAMKLSIIGQFYSAITPASTGGQPVQVLYMSRDGIPAGEATCIISIKFLGFETGLCTFYLLGLLLKGQFLYLERPDIFWLTTTGFLINAAAILFIVLAMVKTEGLRKFTHKTIRFLSRIRLVKKKAETLTKAEKVIGDFGNAVGYIKTNKKKMINVYAISLLHHLCMFSVSFFIYKAFGLKEHSWLDLMTMQALLYVAVSFIPTPGGTIVSEGGFYLFFSMYFPKELVFVSMILWRLVTYYSHIVAGAVIIIFDQLAYLGKGRKK